MMWVISYWALLEIGGGVLSGTDSLPVLQPLPPSRLAACSTSAVALDWEPISDKPYCTR